MSAEQVKPGYKRTEVGVIPEDWVAENLAKVADVKTGPFGSSLHERDYVQDGTPIITVEHLGDFGVEHINLPMISDVDRQRLQAYQLVEGDIVFSRVGSVDRNALIRKSEAGWLFSGRLLRVRPNNSKTHSPFLSFQFHSEPFKASIRSVAVGQTMASLNTQILNSMGVTLPPIAEQRAIAAALSDVDALLIKLDQLITKKRDLKQATMQQLLTGQTRLPGFSGEWEVRRLGDVLRFQVGFPFRSDFFNQEGNGLRLVKNRDLKADDQVFFFSGKFDDSYVVVNGDVLIGMDGDFLPCLWSKGDALLNQRVGRIIPSLSISAAFLYYMLLKPLKSIEYATSATTVKHLSHGDIEGIEFELPEINEQTAIATVLSDMDAELAALEIRRDKTRSLKQGMMQELLTGRIRLV